jgi:hypothetical protein
MRIDVRARRTRRTGAVALLAIACSAPVASIAGAAAVPSGPRLAGTFLLAGRVTDAVNVPDEQRGLAVLRQWAFASTCPAGSCRTIVLTRQRTGGLDNVLLRRAATLRYSGSGSFYAPASCAGTAYPRGQLVRFTISVLITAVAATDAGPVATRLRATYLSRVRRNLTPCVELPAHDAATYHGHLVTPPAA